MRIRGTVSNMRNTGSGAGFLIALDLDKTRASNDSRPSARDKSWPGQRRRLGCLESKTSDKGR